MVILTAKGQDADREAAFRLGANDFLTKPFSPKKLLARIHELLGYPLIRTSGSPFSPEAPAPASGPPAPPADPNNSFPWRGSNP